MHLQIPQAGLVPLHGLLRGSKDSLRVLQHGPGRGLQHFGGQVDEHRVVVVPHDDLDLGALFDSGHFGEILNKHLGASSHDERVLIKLLV
jgi:hypothetical protein